MDSLLKGLCVGTLSLVALAAQATTYVDGTSPALSASPPGSFDLGTHLPGYLGPTVPEGNGTALDGTRVYFYDVNDPAGVLGASAQASFNLLVWQFNSAKDSVRLYTAQDHYFGGPVGNANAPEVLEYSVWGCNSSGGSVSCQTAANWSLLSDPTGWVLDASGNPTYTFNGTAAAEIYRGGSAEFGLANAYVQDFTFASSYDFFAIRGSSIAMQANTADPELDAMVAFNRVDFPGPGTSVPEPGSLALLGLGLAGLGLGRRRRQL
jgi:hypothetical protein